MWFVQWWRRRWGQAPVITVPQPPDPHRLSTVGFQANLLSVVDDVTTLLTYTESLATQLTWISDQGTEMATPLTFSRTETGPITLKCTGADGTPEDLSTASSVTLTVAGTNGTKIVNAVSLTSLTDTGTGVWTRTSPQTATAGDYVAQVTVIRSNTTTGVYPNATTLPGMPMTILPLVGD